MFDVVDEGHNCMSCEHSDECEHPGKEAYMMASMLRVAVSAIPEEAQKAPLTQLMLDASNKLVELQQTQEAVDNFEHMLETNEELMDMISLYYDVNPPMESSDRVRVNLSKVFKWYRTRVETESAPIELEEDE